MSPRRDSNSSRAGRPDGFHPVLFYVLAFAIAWTAWAPLLLVKLQRIDAPVPYPVLLFVCQTLGAFAPLLSLLALQRLKGDPDLVVRVFRRLRLRGTPVRWWLVPAVLPMAIAAATAVLHGLLAPADGLTLLRPEPLREVGWALLLVIPFSYAVSLIGSPLGEEPGWRGYVLDGCRARGHALRGSVLVAVLWWTWHLPLFVVLDVGIDAYSFLELAGHSLLIDSVFILSGRNLVAAMLYHQGVNTSFLFLAGKTQTLGGVVVLLVLAVIARVHAERHLPRTPAPADDGRSPDAPAA